MQTTIHALKEWKVAIAALEQGDRIMLLRKGGIREIGGTFKVAHDQVLLYPTYEHQKTTLLKTQYATLVEPVASGWHPETIQIGSWATITDVLPVWHAASITALLPFHVWNDRFVTDRLQWKPSHPLYVLLLRVYRLTHPQTIAYRPEYGGCKSWIELGEAIALENSTPVMQESDYAEQVEQIRSLVTHE